MYPKKHFPRNTLKTLRLGVKACLPKIGRKLLQNLHDARMYSNETQSIGYSNFVMFGQRVLRIFPRRVDASANRVQTFDLYGSLTGV